MKQFENLLECIALATRDIGQLQTALKALPSREVTYLIENGATYEQIKYIITQICYLPCDLQTFAEKCVKYGMDIERAKMALLNGYDLQEIHEEWNKSIEQYEALREMTSQELKPVIIRKPSLNTRVQDLIRRTGG